MRLFAWLFLLFPLGLQPLWGQTIDRQTQIGRLLESDVLTSADLARAATHQPFLIDRWHLLATAGWDVQTYPEGKGDPSYPVLDLAIWERHSPFDLELLGHIHRLPTAFSRYQIGDTRQILTLFPACEMTRKLNDIRLLTTPPDSGQ